MNVILIICWRFKYSTSLIRINKKTNMMRKILCLSFFAIHFTLFTSPAGAQVHIVTIENPTGLQRSELVAVSADQLRIDGFMQSRQHPLHKKFNI